MTNEKITVSVAIDAPVQKAWEYFTLPEHVTKWNHASDDWHSPHGKNDLRVGGQFTFRMEAKDGSFGFDFGGTYDEVIPNQKIAYTMGDGRQVQILFEEKDGQTHVTETFDAETQNSLEMQRTGWQAILNNFKKYVEQQTK